MYVCVCRAVTDRQIRTALEEGARSMRELRAKLGVCSGCGKCGRFAQEMITDHQVGHCQDRVEQPAA